MLQLSSLDWGIIILFMVVTLGIGLYASKSAGKNSKEFFLSGNNMPWWLLGVSMVATTFSADTPNLVTDIVRNNGVSGNWVWWAFLLTGMLTVFVYARLWRRAGILTDLEFYEMRYSGKEASFLRGFRAIYLGVLFNVMIMASVLLAGIKIGSVMLGLTALQTVLLVSVVTVVYSLLGGLKGVILTDFFQFILSMIGMVVAAIYILDMPKIGGMANLISHENVVSKISFLPDTSNWSLTIELLIIPLAVQWWSTWYPGAEPGGGGYVAQRMLSARDEKGAVKATLFFNIAHYALRPWPWIIIALASLIIFPDLDSIRSAFPNVEETYLKDDLAFPSMLTLLPQGLVGLLLASLIAALMSTISTHLNWGASYIVHDFYSRFINRDISEKGKVTLGRMSTLVLMILAAMLALGYLENAKQAFDLLVLIGAGTGLIFILRWFWWRINAYTEIIAMVVSFIVAFAFQNSAFDHLASYEKLIYSVIITTVVWVASVFFTPATDRKVLISFYKRIKPQGRGWDRISSEIPVTELTNHYEEPPLTQQFLLMIIGCVVVYTALFGMGYLLYGNFILGIGLIVFSLILLRYIWSRSF